MSGHSKWSNIQHRKSNQDFRRSKKFSKIIKEISTAVKETGKNKTSFRLRNAILNAKSVNIPKQTIERAIQKALHNNKKNNNYKNINLEGKVHGISLIIECTTDNSIRTISNIRTFFNKRRGRLCNNGELIHLFNRIGIFSIKKNDIINFSMEDFELMLIDFGAKDIVKEKNIIFVSTNFEYFGFMKNNLEKLKIFHNYEIKRIATHSKTISGKNEKKILNLIEELKKNEDVKNIYSNLLIRNKKINQNQ
ncbi:YebC/PmpR family DNA-binding transcriptional regulator [Blattabacterium cuenoti]|uniref:YebC/PmpR family DNA-binding transcriptional regulator n=1 Tax=Blattabacterium cuenoti TaxID=1653831 RepID=UPI00163C181D|nr:YebC/PmpR family DNA-binding transcriptional regulator [Blattabacterium cuenoti]